MKLILTEQQVGKLMEQLDSLGDIDIETTAPGLAQLIKKISNPVQTMGKNYIDNTIGDVRDKKTAKNLDNLPYKKSEMVHPLGHKQPISSFYGIRNTTVGSKNHKGVDISTPSRSPVYAPLDGIVTRSEDTTPNPCGGHIRLNHGDLETKFCHLSGMIVKPGDKVKRGQLIGYSGGDPNRDPHPGRSTGPHLHYEILKNGIAQDPLSIEKNLA